MDSGHICIFACSPSLDVSEGHPHCRTCQIFTRSMLSDTSCAFTPRRASWRACCWALRLLPRACRWALRLLPPFGSDISTAVSTGAHTPARVPVSSSLGFHLGVERLGHTVILYLTFWGTAWFNFGAECFQKGGGEVDNEKETIPKPHSPAQNRCFALITFFSPSYQAFHL